MRVDLSPRTIAEHLDRSLERLGLAHVDLCLSHAPDEDTPIEATLEGFAAVIEAGKVSHIGACNVTTDQLRDALAASERLGLPRFEWVQNVYNLMTRRRGRALRRLPGLRAWTHALLAGGRRCAHRQICPGPGGSR